MLGTTREQPKGRNERSERGSRRELMEFFCGGPKRRSTRCAGLKMVRASGCGKLPCCNFFFLVERLWTTGWGFATVRARRWCLGLGIKRCLSLGLISRLNRLFNAISLQFIQQTRNIKPAPHPLSKPFPPPLHPLVSSSKSPKSRFHSRKLAPPVHGEKPEPRQRALPSTYLYLRLDQAPS